MGATKGRLSSRGWPPAAVGVLLVFTTLAPAGCGRVPESVSNIDRDRRPAGPWILALPNPVKAGGRGGKTMITWDTGEGNPGRVHLSVDGDVEKPFSTSDRYYADAVVREGHSYDFRLYPAGPRASPLATVRVTVKP